MSKSNTAGGGIGITTAITIVFIILKCTKVIDWPWWDFNPFAGSVLILIVWQLYIILAVIAIAIIAAIAENSK